jgi:hypothetical protein
MAFPGNRKYKLSIPVLSSMITGDFNFDFPVFINHDCLPDAAITLNGVQAINQYGTDLAASSDEAGENRLALQVVSCNLSAIPSDSRVELWIRVPVDTISTITGASIWLWWGDSTENLPANTENYGTHDVWNGITDSTGGSIPVSTWGVWHFNEVPSNPVPQFKDSSGNDHDVSLSGTITQTEFLPGSGVSTTLGLGTTTGTFAPGIGDFAFVHNSRLLGSTNWMFSVGDVGTTGFRSSCTPNSDYTLRIGSEAWAVWDFTSYDCFAAVSRSGTSVLSQINNSNYNWTGTDQDINASTNFNIIASPSILTSFVLLMLSAPNSYWLRASWDNINSPTTFVNITNSIQSAEIIATITFQDLNAESKILITEQPHQQIWQLNLTNARDGYITDEYFTCSVITPENVTLNYYYYFGTDPEIVGADGYNIPRNDGYTATQLATSATSIINNSSYISASVNDTIITIYNDYNGLTTIPVYTGTEGLITLIQLGGWVSTEIDRVDSSIGDWVASYSILKPRRAIIQMIHLNYKPKRYSTILTTSGLTVPAGALQVEDAVYLNP